MVNRQWVGVGVLVSAMLVASAMSVRPQGSDASTIVPRVWDEAALADWATPVAGLNVRPDHLRAQDYYALPVENLRVEEMFDPDERAQLIAFLRTL